MTPRESLIVRFESLVGSCESLIGGLISVVDFRFTISLCGLFVGKIQLRSTTWLSLN